MRAVSKPEQRVGGGSPPQAARIVPRQGQRTGSKTARRMGFFWKIARQRSGSRIARR
jgi:hypothetical protein